MKPVLISGIQPSGRLHIGNYLGALKNFVELQNSGKYRCFFFIADLHALTRGAPRMEQLRDATEVVRAFLAAGLNPAKSTIFLQSAIPAHTELMWILNTITPMGELRRMTQFKDKAANAPENVSVGLFDYPVLMAADILLYDAKFVPVGEDQLQHLELARTLARKFDAKFGKTFFEPQPLITEVPRLMSLDDPMKKMSKSRPVGCLFLDDSPAEIRRKLARATTDSGKEVTYDPERKPGVSNLIRIYANLTGTTAKTVKALYAGKGYAEFKRELAEIVVASLEPFQKRKRELKVKNKKLKTILAAGNKKANAIAEKKLLDIKEKIGIM